MFVCLMMMMMCVLCVHAAIDIFIYIHVFYFLIYSMCQRHIGIATRAFRFARVRTHSYSLNSLSVDRAFSCLICSVRYFLFLLKIDL